MKIKKRDIGRPCDIELKNGEIAHGRIGNIKNGVLSVVDLYIPDVHTSENGQYTSYLEAKTAKVTIW